MTRLLYICFTCEFGDYEKNLMWSLPPPQLLLTCVVHPRKQVGAGRTTLEGFEIMR